MKTILIILFAISLNADIIKSEASASSKDGAIALAKKRSIEKYQKLVLEDISECNSLFVEADEDDVNVVYLGVDNLQLKDDVYYLNATFDIDVKNKTYIQKLKAKCIEKKQDISDQRYREEQFSKIKNNFSLGAGAYLIGDALGAEAIVEYSPEFGENPLLTYAVYANISYNSSFRVDTQSSATAVGIGVRYSLLFLEYDYVLNYDFTGEGSISPATSAYAWGLVLSARKYDVGFIFRMFDDKYTTSTGEKDSTTTGGLYARYKFNF